ncbi:MAG TPA: hydantoinase/oxoprolinase family protein [Candidatus Nanopelagicaceae bacterium]|nr:hydantoinase/oxoprolinase family protein [Candidatus Nanopelagicaceae bacterium]
MSEQARWRIGMDTGGTFTDLVALSNTGEMRLGKVSSTPHNPADAVFTALAESRVDLAAKLDDFVLGTTIATNAVIMRSGSPVILLTTAGFEDVLYIQRIDRPGRYDLQWVKSDPYANRQLTIGVAERVLADGTIRQALSDSELDRVVYAVGELLTSEPTAAIAIAFLFSYVNSAHERMVALRLRAAFPNTPISISSEVSPVWREYERTATTAMDAYVSSMVREFSNELEVGLRENSVGGWHALMKSNGGQAPLAHAAKRPIELVLSGLAGGMIAGAYWARAVGSPKAVTLDMGGTSADVGVVVDGQLQYTGLFEVEWGLPIAVPIIDVSTIGAGGSSIASIGADGLLHVGPASAGADPGPACYGRGGANATVTDANVVMGRLHPEHFLNGALLLDASRATASIEPLASVLNLDVADTADAILSLAVENMAGAVRLVTVDRGHDYRDFDLVAFGGAGPLHAVEIAKRMGMRRVIIPPTPGLVSAFGSIIADQRVDRRTTVVRRLDQPEALNLPEVLIALAAEVNEELSLQRRADEPGEIVITTYVSCRYLGQNYEQEIRTYRGRHDQSFESMLEIDPMAPGFSDRLSEMFHAAHLRAYGYEMRDQSIQSVYVAATATIASSAVEFTPYLAGSQNPNIVKRSLLTAPGTWVEALVLDRNQLSPGFTLQGPAIIEEANSTTYVPPGYLLEVDSTYCLIISSLTAPTVRINA